MKKAMPEASRRNALRSATTSVVGRDGTALPEDAIGEAAANIAKFFRLLNEWDLRNGMKTHEKGNELNENEVRRD